MNFTPVLIITLNRREHLQRCIESLKKNKYAEDTELYIGLDYPPNEKYMDGYKDVVSYLEKGIHGFKNVVILKQKENKGPFSNFVDLQNLAYEKYDRFIYTEDDNEFSSNYLEYMNKALDRYELEENILAVSGYSYPINTEKFSGNVFLCDSYFSALGYGMWKNKEKHMREYLNRVYFEDLYRNRNYMGKLQKTSKNQYSNMVKGMLGYTPDIFQRGCIREVDLTFALYMQAFQMKVVFPVISKVRNWGYDGSGVNCNQVEFADNQNVNHRNYRFDMQKIDTDEEFNEIIEEKKLSLDDINRLLNTFFQIDSKEYWKVKIAYWLSRIWGLSVCRKLIGNKELFE